MKQPLLLLTILLFSGICMSQHRAVLPLELKDKSISSDFVRPFTTHPDLPGSKSPVMMESGASRDLIIINEDIIGTTYYDLQSNASLSNRIHCYEDGTIAAVWTMGNQATSFPDRGTGINYFDAQSWGPAPESRIETLRTGWPSYAPLGSDGEIVVSHDFAAFQLYFNTRPQKGTGDWTQTIFSYSNGPTTLAWPRMTTSGEDHNTIHLLASTYGEYQGQSIGIVYSRSLDGGATWDYENEVLDGTGSDYYLEINADQYVWSNPVGDVIAFLVASAWHDLFMMKSTDNGETWEKTVIWEHPYPFFDWNVTVTDTFFCVDNSATIALDNTGMAHVAFGINRVIHEAVGTTYNYFPYVDGIGYWNEDMPTFSDDLNALAPPQYGYANTELIEDYNYIGWTQDVDGDGEITFVTTTTGFPMSYREMGISTMPTISIGNDNTVVVIYSSTTETYDNFDWNFKKLWMRVKPYGAGWGPFYHLTEDIIHIFDESIYPCAFPTWDDKTNLIYNNDGSPGTALDGDHDYIENRATYLNVALDWYGIGEGPASQSDLPSIAIAPNPSSGMVKINITIGRASDVDLSVTDLAGKELVRTSLGKWDKGQYNRTMDLRGMQAGIYLVSVRTDAATATTKLVIQ